MNVNRNRTRGLLLALVSSLALAAPTGAAAAVTSGSPQQVEELVEAIREHRATTWHWQRVLGKRRSWAGFAERRTNDVARLIGLRKVWQSRATRLKARSKRPPHKAAWRCIHRYEGAWDDPDAPYYGGLQMDLSFQKAYGRYLLRLKGTADNWSPREQMWTAERALRAGRGFYPWPTTARICGLI
jgi:hypothetical protein